MWNIDRSTETIFSNSVGEHRGGFAGVISIAALITGLFLATATYALAAPADSNTVAGVDGTPGIDWVTLQRRPDGANAAPGVNRWRPWLRRRIFNAGQPNARRRIFNAEHPSARRRFFNAGQPSARRRNFNARQPARPHRRRGTRRP